MNETSLMRVEFKYENKAVPTASVAGTEARAVSRRGRVAPPPRRDTGLVGPAQPPVNDLIQLFKQNESKESQ